MRFSIIAPFLNERQYIRHCLDALLAQEGLQEECEILFVDNGSEDGSRAIVASCPQVRLLEEPRRDPYVARNRAIGVARGEYLIFLDADCAPRLGWLRAIAGAVEESRPDILLGNLLYPAPMPTALQVHQDYYNVKTGYLIRRGLCACYYGHAGNMAVHRRVFDEVGLFRGLPEAGDTAIIHDLMAIRPAARVVHVPKAEVVHLEVNTFGECMKKLRECGGYSGFYEASHGYRLLAWREKLGVMRACAKTHDYSLWQRLVQVFALYAGWYAFERGRRQVTAGLAKEIAGPLG
jgi:glycosyltransferase involved in cell wall biosynthesis